MPHWSFDDPEQFAALWYSQANDRMLYPLDYLSRFTHTRERDTYWTQIRHEHSEAAGKDWDEVAALQSALSILADPQVWIEVHGISHHTGRLRIAAAKHHHQGAIATQHLDRDHIDLAFLPANQLIQAILAPLPDCPAGNEPAAEFTTEDLDPNNQPLVHWPDHPTALDRYRQLVDRPSNGAGLITIFRGPRDHGPAPAHKIGILRWYDIKTDGRYLETGQHTRIVRPAHRNTLTNTLAHLLDQAATAYTEYTEDFPIGTR